MWAVSYSKRNHALQKYLRSNYLPELHQNTLLVGYGCNSEKTFLNFSFYHLSVSTYMRVAPLLSFLPHQFLKSPILTFKSFHKLFLTMPSPFCSQNYPLLYFSCSPFFLVQKFPQTPFPMTASHFHILKYLQKTGFRGREKAFL